jgi:hypothetical protein
MKTIPLVLSVLVLTLAGCGGEGDAGEGPLSPEQALDASGEVTVEGSLIAVEGEPVRLCSAILESYPPQCGEPSLEVRGLDLDTLDLASTRPDDEVTAARWSDLPVQVTGTVEDGLLVVP